MNCQPGTGSTPASCSADTMRIFGCGRRAQGAKLSEKYDVHVSQIVEWKTQLRRTPGSRQIPCGLDRT
jgi:hypothetical protein